MGRGSGEIPLNGTGKNRRVSRRAGRNGQSQPLAFQPRRRTPLRVANRDLPEPARGYQPRKLLSIDGGGIRGIIPATILAEIERRTGKPTAETFDMISGTSTGALIALALTVPGEDGRPAWTAQDLVDLYRSEGPKIFNRSCLRRILTGGGVLAPKYSSTALDETVERYLGDAMLSDALADVLIPAYNTEARQPFFFRSERARANAAKNFRMSDVAGAATAAPTYFAGKTVTNEASNRTFSLIDGGVFANNPGMCAWADLDRYGSENEVMMLSIGTGDQTESIPGEKAGKWGLRGWAPHILDVVFDGVSNTTDYQLWEILGDERYLRLQPELNKASDKMDAVSEKNMDALVNEAEKMLQREDGPLTDFLGRLETFSQGRVPRSNTGLVPGRMPTRQFKMTPKDCEPDKG